MDSYEDTATEADFTDDQRSWIKSHVEYRLAGYQKRATTGFIILLIGLAGAVYLDAQHSQDAREDLKDTAAAQAQAVVDSGTVVSVSGCNRDYETIDALRDQLENSLLRIDSLEADGTYTSRQAEVGRQSTRDILRTYKLPDCRAAEKTLTANPDAAVNVPEPRYPDDPQQKADEERERQAREEGVGQP